jgi:hypothetical protein
MQLVNRAMFDYLKEIGKYGVVENHENSPMIKLDKTAFIKEIAKINELQVAIPIFKKDELITYRLHRMDNKPFCYGMESNNASHSNGKCRVNITLKYRMLHPIEIQEEEEEELLEDAQSVYEVRTHSDQVRFNL